LTLLNYIAAAADARAAPALVRPALQNPDRSAKANAI
jgi:hypothetical protein